MTRMHCSPVAWVTGMVVGIAAAPGFGQYVGLALQVPPGPVSTGEEVEVGVYAVAVPEGVSFDVTLVQTVFTWDSSVLQFLRADMNDGDNSPEDKDFIHFGWGGPLNERSPLPPADGDGQLVGSSLFDVVEVDSDGELVGTLVFKVLADAPCTTVSLLRSLGNGVTTVRALTSMGFEESVGPQPGIGNVFAGAAIAGDSFPAVSISAAPGPAVCQGTTVVLDAGPGWAAYRWSNGATTQTIETNLAGIYTVTVTDQAGCQGSAQTAITVHSPPTVSIQATPGTTVCQGTPVTLDAGPDFAGYAWSTGATTRTIEVSQAGVYTVTVTDGNGCQSSAFVTITVHSPPAVSIQASPGTTVCQGTTITLDAGAGFAAYSWSNGATTQTTQVSQSGTYTVTVTDANGCKNTAQISVTVNPLPTVSIQATPGSTVCQGTAVTLRANPAFSSYAWSTGATTRNIQVTQPGKYTVTVTDVNGCQNTAEITVTVHPLPTVSIQATPGAAVCQGTTVTLDAGGGFSSYAWSTGATTRTIQVTQPGPYTVTVIDSNGCQNTAQTSITVHAPPEVTIQAAPPGPVCQGTTVTLDAGAGFATYAWSNGETSRTIEVTEAGTYTVTVTDGNGCQNTAEKHITVNPPPTVSIQASPGSTVCQGTTVTLDAGGGFAGYEWSTGATTQTIEVNEAGTYTVTVTDGNGCRNTAQMQVAMNALPTVQIAASPSASVCAGTIVTLDAGAGFAEYDWSTGATTRTIHVAEPGTYSVTVTDAKGCQNSDEIQITENQPPVVNIQATPGTAVCAGTTVTLDAGPGFTGYRWSTGATTRTIQLPPGPTQAGAYWVMVTDANTCQSIAAIAISVHPQPSVNIQVSPGTTVCEGTPVVLTASSGFSSYAWSSGQSTRTIQVTAAGTYKVTATDSNGCQATAEITISVNSRPVVDIQASPGTAVCAGTTVTLDAGAGFSSYAWSSGQTTRTIQVTEVGTYSVTVTDAKGCSGSDAIELTRNPDPVVTIQASPAAAVCAGTTVTLDAGEGYSGYAWSTGAATRTIQVVEGGTYQVTATDASGCTGTAEIAVTIHSATTATAANSGPVNEGEGVQLSGGPDGMTSYRWTGPNGFTSDLQNPLVAHAQAGQYEYCLTIVDAHGCRSAPACTTVVVKGCTLFDMDYSGFISIVGDVPPFVRCVYLQQCPPEPDLICPGDCNGDGFLSIVGDVPCFVECVYFGNCPTERPAGAQTEPLDDNLTIGGQVYSDMTSPLVSGLAGVLITVVGEGQTYTTTTVASPVPGVWQLRLPPGSYTVTPSQDGHEFVRVIGGQKTSQPTATIQIDAGHLAENQSIQFVDRGAAAACGDPLTIGGQVYADLVNPLTSGVAGVHVVVDGECGHFETDTQAGPVAGLWRIDGVPAGMYTLVLSRGGQCFQHIQAGQADGQYDHVLEVTPQNLAANQSIQFLVGGGVSADFDNDCDVDLDDVKFLTTCSSGPAIPIALTACGRADLDADNDVDQSDLGLLQRCYSGQGRPADPSCLD